MRSFGGFVAGVLLVSCGGGDAPPPPTTPGPPPDSASVRGTLTRTVEGGPVSGATITAGGVTARSGGDGSFALDLPEGSEIGELAEAFNESSRQMREGIKEMFDQRDALKTLYFIADQLSASLDPEVRRRRAVELVGSIFESDCLLITGYTQEETREFRGTLTYRDAAQNIREQAISEDVSLPDIPFFAPVIFDRWLRGDLDGQFRGIDEGVVAKRTGLRR